MPGGYHPSLPQGIVERKSATIDHVRQFDRVGVHLPDSFKSEDADVRKPCAVIWSLG